MTRKVALWLKTAGSRSHECRCSTCGKAIYGYRNAASKFKCPRCGSVMLNANIKTKEEVEDE